MTKEEQIIAFSRSDAPQWFVMRDLKRNNAKLPAYKMLSEMKIEIFTPMKWKIVTKEKKRIPQKVPFMQDLLFVHVTRKVLDPIVERTSTLQYRYLRDGFRTPMTVRDTDMERFIHAVEAADNPQFYAPKDYDRQNCAHHRRPSERLCRKTPEDARLKSEAHLY